MSVTMIELEIYYEIVVQLMLVPRTKSVDVEVLELVDGRLR